MVTNKLYLDDRNNDYIVMCKYGSHTISGCRVTGVGPPEPPPPVLGSKKKPGLNRVNTYSANILKTLVIGGLFNQSTSLNFPCLWVLTFKSG